MEVNSKNTMKYCHRIHEYLYLDHFDGNICLCPWMDPQYAVIGNLLTESVEEAYNSEHANYLRSTIEDQTFRHCRPEACPYLQNQELEEISIEEYNQKKTKEQYPSIINLAHDFMCNQSCETCRSAVFIPPVDYANKMQIIQMKIQPCLNQAHEITASGHGDPFASPYMMDILADLKPNNPQLVILLETNGVFFDEQHWKRIQHLGDVHLEVVVTTNSFDEFTYQHISRGGNFKKLMHNLDFISRLRREGKLKKLMNSIVFQDRNFRELPSFVEKSFRDYDFDEVILKPVYQWGTMDEQVFWYKDVLNPLHPYHQEYFEILQNPILHDPRVYNFGGKTVHPARPYPIRENVSLFAYDKIQKGSKIILYGAGQVGQTVMKELQYNQYCEVVLWVDKNSDGVIIKSPQSIKKMLLQSYDSVFIATSKKEYVDEIETVLKGMGVPKERIISNF